MQAGLAARSVCSVGSAPVLAVLAFLVMQASLAMSMGQRETILALADGMQVTVQITSVP